MIVFRIKTFSKCQIAYILFGSWCRLVHSTILSLFFAIVFFSNFISLSSFLLFHLVRFDAMQLIVESALCRCQHFAFFIHFLCRSLKLVTSTFFVASFRVSCEQSTTTNCRYKLHSNGVKMGFCLLYKHDL